MSLEEAIKTEYHHLYFVVDNKTNSEIFSVSVNRNGYWYIENNELGYNETDIEVSSLFYQDKFVQFILNCYDHINTGVISKESLLYYIKKIENISSWYNCIYKPKWKDVLKTEFFEYVKKYIENDLYLFAQTIDGVSVYESNNGEKRWIKE